MRQLRRAARSEAGHDLALEIGPGEAFGLDLDARVFRLEAARDIVECLDGLRFGLGVPDPHDLVGRQRRAAGEQRGGECRGRNYPVDPHRYPPMSALVCLGLAWICATRCRPGCGMAR